MSSKFSCLMCALALTACYVSAQERATRTDAKAGDQPAAAQSRSSDEQPRNNAGQARERSQTKTEQNRTNDATTRTQTTDRETRTVDSRDYRRTDASDNHLDSILASCLILGNEKEVAISRFAAERAQNEKVKEFAQHMVDKHTQAIAKLQKFADHEQGKSVGSESSRSSRTETNVNESQPASETPRSGSETPAKEPSTRPSADSSARAQADATARTEKNNDAAPKQAGRKAATPNASNEQDKIGVAAQANPRDRSVTTSVEVRTEQEAMPDRMKAIAKEVNEKWVSLTKSKMEQCPSFDQAYMGVQIGGHIEMIAHLETYRSYASEELRQVIQESHSTAQEHLQKATEIAEELAKNSSGGEVRRSETRPGAQGKEANSSEAGAANTGRNESGARNRREARKEGKNANPNGNATPNKDSTPDGA